MEGLKIIHTEAAGDWIYEELEKILPAEILDHLKEEKVFLLCAGAEDQGLVGMMAVSEGEDLEYLIRYIYVLPDFRRMGIASALIQYLLTEMAAVGGRRLLIALYLKGMNSEPVHALFLKQPNFTVREQTDGEFMEAIWDGMTIAEKELLLEDGIEKEESYYEDLVFHDEKEMMLLEELRLEEESDEIGNLEELLDMED
jgi:GNAT superfamily N-acetyltransferase